MIVDWIFHPFGHLEGGGHMAMHHAGAAPAGTVPSFAERRIIFLKIASAAGAASEDRASLFAIGAARVPLFFADVDMHELKVAGIHELGPGTGWGQVPTPMF